MFLLSSRYNLKFHACLRGIICVHQFSAYYCIGLYYSLHTRQGLTLFSFRHNVGGNPVELSRYNINMAIADNYSLAKNAQNSID